jgi:predicted nucleic-acid-binding protein
MIGLDTNILVRHLTQDDPGQSPQATEIIERRLTDSDPGFVSIVAMVETVWVLESTYRFSDTDIAAAVERMLQIDTLVIENEREVFIAMTALRDGRGSFADGLIALLGVRAGCSHTVTFDRAALRLPGFAPVIENRHDR